MNRYLYINCTSNGATGLRLWVDAASRKAADRKAQRKIDTLYKQGVELPRLAAYEVREIVKA